ncbi:MAG: hypothetical protein H0W88_12630 [Parachlamydiaceae bacterium]|nr:hypothetical protein [Parachlamydiaceae bacterium]
MPKTGFSKNYSHHTPLVDNHKITKIRHKFLMGDYFDADITTEPRKIKFLNNQKTHTSIIAPSNFKGLN